MSGANNGSCLSINSLNDLCVHENKIDITLIALWLFCMFINKLIMNFF